MMLCDYLEPSHSFQLCTFVFVRSSLLFQVTDGLGSVVSFLSDG